MTIYNGSEGSICIFYKGLLISSFPLSKKKTLDKYLYQGDYIIKESKHINIKQQIKTYLYFCNIIYIKKKKKYPIYRSDHQLFLSCVMALIRLKIIDNDNEEELSGYMCFPKCKKKLKI